MRNPLSILPKRIRNNREGMRASNDFESELERWFDLRPSAWVDEYENIDFAPTGNFIETNKNFVIRLDIPGVKKKDINIEAENNRLVISGHRSSEKKDEDEKHYLAETFYGSFMRSFTLPAAVDESKIDAHFDNGVLTITLPKTESSKGKKVEIH